MEANGLELLLFNFISDSDITIWTKALGAISCKFDANIFMIFSDDLKNVIIMWWKFWQIFIIILWMILGVFLIYISKTEGISINWFCNLLNKNRGYFPCGFPSSNIPIIILTTLLMLNSFPFIFYIFNLLCLCKTKVWNHRTIRVLYNIGRSDKGFSWCGPRNDKRGTSSTEDGRAEMASFNIMKKAFLSLSIMTTKTKGYLI